MKLIKIITLSLIATLPILGMEKQPQSWKDWLFGTPIATTSTQHETTEPEIDNQVSSLTSPSQESSNTPLKESEILIGFLPRELREELKKFITHDKKSAQAFWALQETAKNNYNQKTLTSHASFVNALAYNPVANHLYFYTGFFDDTIKIWDLNSNTCIATLTGHTNLVTTLTYNPMTNQLYSGSYDDTIKIWDLTTYACIATLSGHHTNSVHTFVYNQVTNQLYSASIDRAINVWDLNTLTRIATLSGHASFVLALAYNPTTNQLYSGSSDATIKIWDLNTHTCIATLSDHTNSVCMLACNPVTNQLYSGSHDNTIKVWDLNAHTCRATLLGPIFDHTILACTLAYNPTTNQLYSVSADKTIRVWQLEDPTLTQEFKKMSMLQTLALQQTYECTITNTPLNAKILALLDHGPANLSALKKVIKETCKIK